MRKLSLHRYLMTCTFTVLGAVGLMVIWRLTAAELASVSQSYQQRATLLATTLAASFGDTIKQPCIEHLKHVADALRTDPDITSVEIFDQNHKLLMQSGSMRFIRGETVDYDFITSPASASNPRIKRTPDHLFAFAPILTTKNLENLSQDGGVVIVLSREQEKNRYHYALLESITFGVFLFCASFTFVWWMLRLLKTQTVRLTDPESNHLSSVLEDDAPGFLITEFDHIHKKLLGARERFKNAQIRSKLYRDRLQRVLAQLPHIICECDSTGTIHFCNLPDKQLRNIRELLHPLVRTEFEQALQQTKEGDHAAPIEFEDERHCWYSLLVAPTHYPANRGRFLAILSNITEKRSAEELRNLNKQLQSELEDATKTTSSKEQFLANMSHEIRTPMNSIIGFCELLADTPLSAEQREWISIIQYNGQALMSLVNQILDLSKIRNASFTIEKSIFDLRSRFHLVLSSFQGNMKNSQVELRHLVDPKLPEFLFTDPHAFHQILVNLLRNALKFTERGSVTVSLEYLETPDPHTPQLLLCVLDTGCGIPKSQQAKVFDPFSQVDPASTRRFNGAGLGLSITKSLVELLGGSISFESEPGIGTVFRIIIPVEVMDPVTGKNPDLPSDEKNKAPYRQPQVAPIKTLRVVLAEDNPFNQKLMTLMLAKESILPEIVANGEDLIKILREKPFDMVIMDVNMPKMDGLEATRLIRSGFAGESNRNVYIAAFTAAARREDADRCYKAGMDGFLSKPFRPDDLLRLMHRCSLKQQRHHSIQTTETSTSLPAR